MLGAPHPPRSGRWIQAKPPARTVEVPGGRQAVQRSEIVDVRAIAAPISYRSHELDLYVARRCCQPFSSRLRRRKLLGEGIQKETTKTSPYSWRRSWTRLNFEPHSIKEPRATEDSRGSWNRCSIQATVPGKSSNHVNVREDRGPCHFSSTVEIRLASCLKCSDDWARMSILAGRRSSSR